MNDLLQHALRSDMNTTLLAQHQKVQLLGMAQTRNVIMFPHPHLRHDIESALWVLPTLDGNMSTVLSRGKTQLAQSMWCPTDADFMESPLAHVRELQLSAQQGFLADMHNRDVWS